MITEYVTVNTMHMCNTTSKNCTQTESDAWTVQQIQQVWKEHHIKTQSLLQSLKLVHELSNLFVTSNDIYLHEIIEVKSRTVYYYEIYGNILKSVNNFIPN